MTYALAKQLFITLDGPLSEEAMAKLDALWAQIAKYGANIASVPLDQIQSQLNEFERQILAIIEEDQPGTLQQPAASATASATASGSSSPAASGSAAPSGSPVASPSSGESGTSSPTASSSGTGSARPSPSGSTSPTPSGSASPTASPVG